MNADWAAYRGLRTSSDGIVTPSTLSDVQTLLSTLEPDQSRICDFPTSAALDAAWPEIEAVVETDRRAILERAGPRVFLSQSSQPRDRARAGLCALLDRAVAAAGFEDATLGWTSTNAPARALVVRPDAQFGPREADALQGPPTGLVETVYGASDAAVARRLAALFAAFPSVNFVLALHLPHADELYGPALAPPRLPFTLRLHPRTQALPSPLALAVELTFPCAHALDPPPPPAALSLPLSFFTLPSFTTLPPSVFEHTAPEKLVALVESLACECLANKAHPFAAQARHELVARARKGA